MSDVLPAAKVLASPAPSRVFERRTFTTSRLAEFTSVRELTTQTGHAPEAWPLVIAKELIDNALDAAEKAGVAPAIELAVENDRIAVTDNGAGIAPETVANILDYTSRTSDKEAYLSPTRGAQGNALKTLLAMPFALDGSTGRTVIESRGVAHTITFAVDPIRHEPRIDHTTQASVVNSGTRVTVHLPLLPCSQGGPGSSRFLQLASDFSALNPHLALTVTGRLNRVLATRTAAAWRKWTPAEPIPAHWYTKATGRFERLIAAHIADDQDTGRSTTVREFIATFRGMTATAKQKAVLEATGTARVSLADFYAEGNNRGGVGLLLDALCEATKPVKPADLGVIGRAHVEAVFEAVGAMMEWFEYGRHVGVTGGGLPFVLEIAFAIRRDDDDRRLVTGLNFSPTLANPFRSSPGFADFDELLANQYADADEPVIMLIHLTCPALAFTDRGKSQVVLDGPVGSALCRTALKVTDAWCKQRKQEERDERAREKRENKKQRSRKVSIKDAAYEVMETAWLKASGNGALPANARQIMYAARPDIQEITGKQLNDAYFTQVLLPDYIAETGADWDVVFDARGHFREPHGGSEFGVGTLDVRRYLASRHQPLVRDAALADSVVVTTGPDGNYGAIFYIEKEGFDPLFEQVRLADRFDVGFISTKGMSVTAARTLVAALCSGEQAIPLLILHDFDKSGFSIASTIQRDTRRFNFARAVKVIDLGLRLADVRALGLEGSAERVYDKGSREARAKNLRANGATEEEVDFLLDRRVELNALTSDQMVAFIERKLRQHNIRKIVPEHNLLARAYEAAMQTKQARGIVARVLRETAATVTVPHDLQMQVEAVLRANPEIRWDDAIRMIAERSEE